MSPLHRFTSLAGGLAISVAAFAILHLKSVSTPSSSTAESVPSGPALISEKRMDVGELTPTARDTADIDVDTPSESPATEESRSVPAEILAAAATDLGRALDTISSGAPADNLQEWTLLALIESSRNAPDKAAEHIRRLSDPELRLQAFDSILSQWATVDFRSAILWADQLGDQGERQAALAATLRSQSETNPRSTLDLAETVLGPSYDYDRLAFSVLQSWIHIAPRDALDWAADKLQGPVRVQAFESFLKTWAQESPTEAVTWARGLQPGKARNEALLVLGSD